MHLFVMFSSCFYIRIYLCEFICSVCGHVYVYVLDNIWLAHMCMFAHTYVHTKLIHTYYVHKFHRENRIGVNGATTLAKALTSNDGLKVLKVSHPGNREDLSTHTYVRTYVCVEVRHKRHAVGRSTCSRSCTVCYACTHNGNSIHKYVRTYGTLIIRTYIYF